MVDKFIGSVLKPQQPGDERGQAWNLSQKHISSFSVREACKKNILDYLGIFPNKPLLSKNSHKITQETN